MALQENFQEPAADFETLEDALPKQKQKCVPSQTTPPSENSSGCCECNICLDSAREPVVTLCGHLYCWPCIYKWLHVHNSSFEPDNQPKKCPVCKANISNSSLVPLYGRGNSSEPEPKRPHMDPVIPNRPLALGPTIPPRPSQQIHPNFFQQQSFPHPFGNYASLAATNVGGTSMTFSPNVGVFGEMFFAMMFRSSGDAGFYAYPYGTNYQNSYPAMGMGNGSPRMRRQVMRVEKSLNRLTIFFFCCFILCLLLF